MSNLTPDRRILEDLWRSRLNDAKLRLDFAHGYLAAVQGDYAARDIPASDHHFAYQKALRAEGLALQEYRRVLHIFADLLFHGIIPDEADWHRRHAANSRTGEPDPE
jgi:hypothetical protein